MTMREQESSQDSFLLGAIDAYVIAQMRSKRLPGLALGIVKGNRILHLRGFGIADLAGRPVTPQMPFIIGSLTKSFTALAIMQLVEAGQLELDAPVQRYIPWFRVNDPQASTQITLRHLLNHTSGISRYVGRELLAGTGDGTIEQRVRELRTVTLTQPVGASFQYSNTNYLILGLLIEIVSGQSYEFYIQQHIFTPLEMQHSFASQGEALRDGLVTGYRWWFGIPFPAHLPYLDDALPAGFLLSSAEDMAHYLIAHMNGGRHNETSILSPAGIAELHRPEVSLSTSARYGMGWLTETVNGLSVLTHTGDTANFHADMVILPQSQVGIIILANANNVLASQVETVGQLGMWHIAADVTSLLVGQQPPTTKLNVGVFYQIFNLVLFLLSSFQLWSLVRLLHYQRRPLRPQPLSLIYVLPLTWELILPVAVLKNLPKWTDAPWSILKLYTPDLAYWLLVTLPLMIITGIIRIVFAFMLPP